MSVVPSSTSSSSMIHQIDEEKNKSKLIKVRNVIVVNNCNNDNDDEDDDDDDDGVGDDDIFNNSSVQPTCTNHIDDDDAVNENDDDVDNDGGGEDDDAATTTATSNNKQLQVDNNHQEQQQQQDLLLLNRRRSCRRRRRRLCCSYNNIINNSNTSITTTATINKKESSSSTSTSTSLPDCKVRRNYTCPNCEFFTQNPRLYLYHLRDVHYQRIKVYECPNCLYASKHFQKLLRHTKMVHGMNHNNNINNNNDNCGDTSKRSTRKQPQHTAVATTTTTAAAIECDDETEDTRMHEEEHQHIPEEDSLIDEITLSSVGDSGGGGVGTDNNTDGGGDGGSVIIDDDIDTNSSSSSSLFKCSICTFTSRGPLQLTKHEREEHIKTKFFRCSKCTYVTHIKARYTKHVKYHSMPMIKCDMCDFRTPYKWNLDRHCKNHNGKGQFHCSACNFTADIKQSLTVHEMNHHVPPVGQAAGIGVGRRRNKVGASDTQIMTVTEEFDEQQSQQIGGSELFIKEEVPAASAPTSTTHTRSKTKIRVTTLRKQSKQSSTNSNNNNNSNINNLNNNNNNNNNSNNNGVISESSQGILGSDFIHPDDFIHHSNGKVYIKIKCKLCNYKTAWDSEMARHERKIHNINRETTTTTIKLNDKSTISSVGGGGGGCVKKTLKPIPNLIPIPSGLKLNHRTLKTIDIDRLVEPIMSEKDINDIYNRSTNSSLKDLASLFRFEDVVMKNSNSSSNVPTVSTPPTTATAAITKVPDLIPASSFTTKMTNSCAATMAFKQKNASFFDRLKEKLEIGTGCNLICTLCGHESKCLTEQVKHQKICNDGLLNKDISKVPNIIPVHNISASRCQYCRQRCKSSADLYTHLQSCQEALKFYSEDGGDKVEMMEDDSSEHDLKIEEDDDDELGVDIDKDTKPHPMENKVFVWNNIVVPMDIEVDDSNYEYTEDRIDDNVSLDLSIRTQSPACSENSYVGREPPQLPPSQPPLENNTTSSVQPQHHRRHHAVTSRSVQPAAAATPMPTNQTPPEKIPTHGNDISIAQHKRVFKCPHCSFWASTASRFHVHIVGHLNKKPFECSLCSYRSNWRWDITKHIKLKSVRDQAHESAKVLMTDETGRRNYSKYNKYLTEIPLSSLQSSTETSGGSGTRPRNQQQPQHENNRNHSPINNNNNYNNKTDNNKGHHHQQNHHSNNNNNNNKSSSSEMNSILKTRSSSSVLPPPPPLRNMDKHFFANVMQERRKNTNGMAATASVADNNNKRTMFKCKKCDFRDISRDILLQHVKGHYPPFSSEHSHHDQQQHLQQYHHKSGLAAISPQSTSQTSLFAAASAYPAAMAAVAAAAAAAAMSAAGGGGGTEPPLLSTSVTLSPTASASSPASSPYVLQDLSLRGTSPDRDEASVNNSNATLKGCTTTPTTSPIINAPFRCGHCNQVSNWKHVIQRHCRLKHNGDIRVVSTKNGQEKIEIEDQLLDDNDFMEQQTNTNSNGAINLMTSSGSGGGDCIYKCTICPYTTNNQDEFQQHSSGHDDQRSENTFKCTICKYGVTQDVDLYNHLKLHGICDPEEYLKSVAPASDVECKKFRCMLCPYVTNSKSQYTYHKQFHKARGGQYTCSCCSYNVSKRHLLHQHLKVHGITVSSASSKQNNIINTQSVNSVTETNADDLNDYEMIVCEDEEEDITNKQINLLTADFDDIPLVWVSKNGRFSKMYKCRYCPHINMRKVNIHEHEKMHRDSTDAEYKCSQCNYVCSNAGVLSTHIKFHQGSYGIVQSLVDFNRSDEEQIKELQQQSLSDLIIDTSEFLEVEMDDSNQSVSESLLYFCSECPARFLKENEYEIHRNFHNSQLNNNCQYKCEHCSFSAETESYLLSHLKVHQSDYQDRTNTLKTYHSINANHPAPILKELKTTNGEFIWKVMDNQQKNNILVSFLNKPIKSGPIASIPLSGTDLFQKKSEAQQQQQQQQSTEKFYPKILKISSTTPELQFGEKMQGNPEFIYQKYIKNGRMKEKRYKCHKCPSAFEKREQYKVHLGLHGSKQRFNCESCDYSVKYYANYAQHLKKHKFNEEAHAAAETSIKRQSFDNDNDNNDDDGDGDIIKECVDTDAEQFKLSAADQQIVNITEQRMMMPSTGTYNTNTNNNNNNTMLTIDDKKMYDCQYCPYLNGRKDAVENHMRRHEIVSGYKSSYQCDHCDYSVPQAHFLREHIKLHFIPNNKITNHQVNGYMICDNLKLISKGLIEASKIDKNDDKLNDDSKEFVIYEENEKCNVDTVDNNKSIVINEEEKFNNNNNNNNNNDNVNIKGDEPLLVDTGALVVKSEEISDIHLDKNNCQMEVN